MFRSLCLLLQFELTAILIIYRIYMNNNCLYIAYIFLIAHDRIRFEPSSLSLSLSLCYVINLSEILSLFRARTWGFCEPRIFRVGLEVLEAFLKALVFFSCSLGLPEFIRIFVTDPFLARPQKFPLIRHALIE